MSVYGWIYIGLVGACVLLAVAFIIFKSFKQSQIQKSYFEEGAALEYQRALSKFMQEYNITEDDELSSVIKKADFQIVECARSNMPKGYDGRINNKEIRIAEDLTTRQKNAIIAHEMAHYLRNKSSLSESGCKTKTILVRPGDEQVCDYIASLILLPSKELKQMLNNMAFDTMQRKKRVQFIAELADERNISTSIVAKRIAEECNSLESP